MAINVVPRGGTVTVTIPAGGALGVFTANGSATISSFTSYAQQPAVLAVVAQTVAGTQYTTSTYSSGATLLIQAPYGDEAYYEVGTAPVVNWVLGVAGNMSGTGTAGTMNTSATFTVAQLLGGVLTSSTAAAVTATLPTGTVFDAGSSFNVGDWVELSIVNTGGTNAITVTTATGWTLAGTMAVAANTSGRFRMAKTAANTFTCWRVS